jgi:aminomethyltransferase
VSESLQDTPLRARHEELGARFAPFAGWRLPLQFEGTRAEHTAVREAVGVFDVSHLGTIWITGPDAVGVLADAFTNDPWGLADGDSQYTLCCDEEGGVVDDLIVARLAPDRVLAMPNAANNGAVRATLEAVAGRHRAEVDDASTGWAVLAVQGPDSLAMVEQVLGLDVAGLGWTHVTTLDDDGHEVVVSRTGYTGEPGCELVAPAAAAPGLWDRVLAAGATPCGLGARDTLRLEMGYPLHGHELVRDRSPFEARMGWAVRLDREGTPPGADALRAARERGTTRRVWGLQGASRRPPREGMAVLRGDEVVGTVTSGSFSPTLDVAIGLAVLDDPVEPGDRVEVDLRGAATPFDVVRPPFVDRDPRG